MTDYQLKQIEVINELEKQARNNSLQSSAVSPVNDFDNDDRMCLTSSHNPTQGLKDQINKKIIEPLIEVEPNFYYYSLDSLHITIKNVRIINNPPHFDKEDILKAEKVFAKVIPSHKKFKVYFYRLILFPTSLALVGTTDEELDKIVLDLDRGLNKAGIPDDKKYINSKYFFCNMSLVRFSEVSKQFEQKAQEISSTISFAPYTIDSANLLTCNAAYKKRQMVNSWKLA